MADEKTPEIFIKLSCKPDACKHDFTGWRDLCDDEGRVAGGEQVCSKCGMGAMHYSLMMGD